MDTSALDFIVIEHRTRNSVAAFLLPGDALEYITFRRSVGGSHGPIYEICNADGSFVGWGLQEKVHRANAATG
jgi:hypothetical protein